MQQFGYSVWAQSTELGRVLYYDTPLFLSFCALVETSHLKKKRTATKSFASEEVFFKVCVLGMDGGFSVQRWRPSSPRKFNPEQCWKAKKNESPSRPNARFSKILLATNNADLECWGNVGLM